MDNERDIYKQNRITIEGKHYYMMVDFIKLTKIKTPTAYQMVARKVLPDNHVLKLNGVVFIDATEVDERLKKEIRRMKIESILNSAKLDSIADDKLDELNKFLNT
ncbi:MAG TPA: hypothetical protein PK784_05525 [Tenuifilaceae bacterium]|nr:hypothetical protein [Tenuifilaceae bacterium]HPN21588.1 hypothetical protein [Tenuifilaceae bacterium]